MRAAVGQESETTHSKTNRETSLVCFDFDWTILNGHSHNVLADAKIKAGEEKAFFNMIFPQSDEKYFQNKKLLLETFNVLFNQGHNIAITSFTHYPKIIIPSLERLGLTNEQLERIYVIAWLPETNEIAIVFGKNPHIEKAMKHFKVAHNELVILIDDSATNIEAAKKYKFKTVLVPPGINPPNHSYLSDAIKIGKEIADEALKIAINPETEDNEKALSKSISITYDEEDKDNNIGGCVGRMKEKENHFCLTLG